MHYVMDDLEVDYLLDAVDFMAQHGRLFLPLYSFDLYDGSWSKKDDPSQLQEFSLQSALQARMGEESPMPLEVRRACYQRYLKEAVDMAAELGQQDLHGDHDLDGTLGKLQFFTLPQCCVNPDERSVKKGVMGRLKAIFSH